MKIHKQSGETYNMKDARDTCEIRRRFNLSCKNCAYREKCRDDKELLDHLNKIFGWSKKRVPFNG